MVAVAFQRSFILLLSLKILQINDAVFALFLCRLFYFLDTPSQLAAGDVIIPPATLRRRVKEVKQAAAEEGKDSIII